MACENNEKSISQTQSNRVAEQAVKKLKEHAKEFSPPQVIKITKGIQRAILRMNANYEAAKNVRYQSLVDLGGNTI